MKAILGKKIHFIGIGGIGMSGIAEILLRSGYTVSGSDTKENIQTTHLTSLGAKVYIGHRAENIGDADIVVYSSAISATNSEMLEAQRKELSILARAEMLAELMRLKHSIVVSGAHGKTTTSAMVMTLLMEAGLDPTVVIGGRLRAIAGNAYMGTGQWFVAESDESDGSFLKLLPTVAVITNIDREHLDHYRSFENLVDAFVDFANRVPFDGLVVACIDDPVVAGILERIKRPLLTYGLSPQAKVRATHVDLFGPRTVFTLEYENQKASVELSTKGMHNVLNALGAASVGLSLGLSMEKIVGGLNAFSGIERRMEYKGEAAGVTLYDDYAHHPTEVRATLDAFRTLHRTGKLRVLFQPHRYTRVRDLWDPFISAFDHADEVVMLPIYAASEKEIPGITSENLARAISKRGKTIVEVAATLDAAVKRICERSRSGDSVVTMGAGDVTKAGAMVLRDLVECSE